MNKPVLKIDYVINYLFYLGKKDGISITNKKLQKLLYYVQAWHLVFNNGPIFSNKIEAWVHGPAISEVYLKFRENGSSPIKHDIKVKDLSEIKKEQAKVIDTVWNVYGKKDANYLELLTHNEEPWQKTRDGISCLEASNKEIPLSLMKSFYSERLATSI